MKKVALYLLKIYQKFFTLLGYGSCRYYPTCSEYAKWQFENNNFLLAIFYSTKRVLSCNQLFDGGFDYPIIKRNFSKIEFKLPKQNIKYWFIPVEPIEKSKKFYVLKNIFKG